MTAAGMSQQLGPLALESQHSELVEPGKEIQALDSGLGHHRRVGFALFCHRSVTDPDFCACSKVAVGDWCTCVCLVPQSWLVCAQRGDVPSRWRLPAPLLLVVRVLCMDQPHAQPQMHHSVSRFLMVSADYPVAWAVWGR